MIHNDAKVEYDGEQLDAPLSIYADQLAQLTIGTHVTKLIFGIEKKQGEIPSPVVKIVMPTEAFVSVVDFANSLLTNQELKDKFKTDLLKYSEKIEKL